MMVQGEMTGERVLCYTVKSWAFDLRLIQFVDDSLSFGIPICNFATGRFSASFAKNGGQLLDPHTIYNSPIRAHGRKILYQNIHESRWISRTKSVKRSTTQQSLFLGVWSMHGIQ